jgi:hypothetical protein
LCVCAALQLNRTGTCVNLILKGLRNLRGEVHRRLRLSEFLGCDTREWRGLRLRDKFGRSGLRVNQGRDKLSQLGI